MIGILKNAIEDIRLKEENCLIVLKGFDKEIFGELTKEITPAFFEEIYSLKELLENKKKLQKKLIILEEGIYISRYEEILIAKNNLNLYEGKIYILENNLFSYYLYDFEDKDEISEYIKIRNNEIILKDEKIKYDYFYSDLILSNDKIYVKYKI